jgi:DNA repair protein RecO (recombination protein O)
MGFAALNQSYGAATAPREDHAMEWTDIAIVLGARSHGEANAVAELMTREHGRHLGLVRGGSGSRHSPVLQAGNRVTATWRARLDEHLGYYIVEGLDLRSGFYLSAAHALYGVHHLAALCRVLPERDPHREVFDALDHTLAGLAEPASAASLIARFELRLLADLGYGLDLAACAITGATCDLVYVSPRSGRAVSDTAGEPWRDRLLPLPAFLREPGIDDPSAAALRDGFTLTGFFLARHVFEPRGEPLPQARAQFIAAVARRMSETA